MSHDDMMATTIDQKNLEVEDLQKTKAVFLKQFEYFEHMISAHVVLQNVKYKCKKCDAAFLLRQKFHDHLVSHAVQEKNKRYGSYDENLVSGYNHNLPENLIKHLTSAHVVLETLPETVKKFEAVSADGNKITNGDVRFIKRHLCKKCGEMFVKKTTLEAHAVVHEPYPHICDCGIGFYKKSDLGQHRTLLHFEEVKKELENITSRQQRDLINDLWVPNVMYVKKEPATGGYKPPNKGPRLKAELAVKTKKKRIRSSGSESGSILETYDCNLCDKKFLERGRLNVHMKIHGNKDICCSYCGKGFNDFYNMKNHERIHTGLKPFLCSFCQKGFSDPSARLRHERIHTGIKPYTCKFCGKSFSDASARCYHEKRHTNDKKFPCEICGKKFYIPYYREKHMNAVHSGKIINKKFECHLCSRKFAVKSYLYMHMKTHSTTKEFHCDYCTYKTNFKTNLIHHIDINHLKLVHRHQCDRCPFKAKFKHLLMKHIDIKHLRITDRHRCDHCPFETNYSKNLIRHMNSLHSNKSDLKENKCNTSTKSKSGLAKHSTQRKRLLDCIFCTDKFKNKAILEEHYDNMHNDQKRLECDDCGMKHISKHSLRQHIFNEHMEFLYCNACSRRFYSDTDLKRHKLKSC